MKQPTNKYSGTPYNSNWYRGILVIRAILIISNGYFSLFGYIDGILINYILI